MSTRLFLLSAFVVLSITLNSCSYTVSREGYTKSDTLNNCEVFVFRNLNIDSNFKKVGSIKISAVPFTDDCDKYSAFVFLKKEACFANANIVNITQEYDPNPINDCYRCDADVYLNTGNFNHWMTYNPGKYIEMSPFKYMPFNYFIFSVDYDYSLSDKHYWSKILHRYNLPYAEIPQTSLNPGFICIYKDFYLELNLGFSEDSSKAKDSLSSNLSMKKISLNIGYDVLNKEITI